MFPEEDMAAIAEATRAFSIEGAPINELSDAIRSALENSNPSAISPTRANPPTTPTEMRPVVKMGVQSCKWESAFCGRV